jgi:hypothetical protein
VRPPCARRLLIREDRRSQCSSLELERFQIVTDKSKETTSTQATFILHNFPVYPSPSDDGLGLMRHTLSTCWPRTELGAALFQSWLAVHVGKGQPTGQLPQPCTASSGACAALKQRRNESLARSSGSSNGDVILFYYCTSIPRTITETHVGTWAMGIAF